MKKKGKQLIALILCGVLLVGCGKSKSSQGNATSAGSTLFKGELERNVAIRVLENDTAIERGYFKELIDAFNEKYKEYGIVAVDANMDQYLDLANDGPYGYGPDVLYQANDVLMKYVKGKHILPLPVESLNCYDQIPEVAWKAYQTEVDGKVYTCGVPVIVQAPMLYYRKDMLPKDWDKTWDDNKNGIPDMLEDWNAMYRYSKEIHETDNTKYGYMESLYDPYFSTGYLFSYGGYIFGQNNTDSKDIGLGAGDAYKGIMVLKQLAGIMNEECIDETIQRNVYAKLADGTYFATISTPDVYTTFLKELITNYEKDGLSKDEAKKKAEVNLVITSLPQLPVSGDITQESNEFMDMKAMGGINGYAISAYTSVPNACLAFVDFASSYDMLMKRNEFLGIAPARNDAATATGGLSAILYEKLATGQIIIMPSIQEVAQIWDPLNTFFSDLAKDAFRKEGEQKYTTKETYQKGLDTVSKQIYDAIFTLSTTKEAQNGDGKEDRGE